MAETTGLPFEKKAIIPIDPRTKIFLTVTVSTIMVAGGTGGIMTVIRPCLMAFPMCLLLLSKRWKSVLKFSAMYAVLFALELTVLPLLTGTWNFVLGAAIGIYTHMLPGFIMGYYLIESTTVSEFVAAMERVHIPQGFGIIPTSIFHFRAMDLKIRKSQAGTRLLSKPYLLFLPLLILQLEGGKMAVSAKKNRKRPRLNLHSWCDPSWP